MREEGASSESSALEPSSAGAHEGSTARSPLADAHERSLATRLHDYFELTKPKVVALIVFTAIVGMLLAAPDVPPLPLAIYATLGIWLAAASAAAINHVLDRRIDAEMARTRRRPIPTGHVSEVNALLFAFALGLASMLILALLVNPLTAMLTFASLIGYSVIYTLWLKRATPQNIVIGGAAGAAPPVLGWSAITDSVDPNALLLFLIIFTWTPPHFWALAIARRDDYAKVGLPMLPVTHGIEFTRLHILLYTILLVVVTLLPYLTGMSGLVYLVGTLVLDVMFLRHALVLMRGTGLPIRTFRFSINYLMWLFALLLVDHYVIATARAETLPATTDIATRAVATLKVPGSPDFLAADGADVWVTNDGRVEKLRAGEAKPVSTIRAPAPCGAMVIAFESLWVANCRDAALTQIDTNHRRIKTVILTGLADPNGELSIAAGANSIWLLTDAKGVLSRIDPDSGKVIATVKVKPGSFAAVFGFGAVWVTNTDEVTGSVQCIDPATNSVVATIPVGPTPRFLAVGEGGVWTLNQGDGSVTRIDPHSRRVVATIAVGVPGFGGDIATGAGRVWVRATNVLLSAIDPATNTVVARFGPPAGSGGVRVAGDTVWVTAHDIHTVWAMRSD
jgi:heme o synthase